MKPENTTLDEGKNTSINLLISRERRTFTLSKRVNWPPRVISAGPKTRKQFANGWHARPKSNRKLIGYQKRISLSLTQSIVQFGTFSRRISFPRSNRRDRWTREARAGKWTPRRMTRANFRPRPFFQRRKRVFWEQKNGPDVPHQTLIMLSPKYGNFQELGIGNHRQRSTRKNRTRSGSCSFIILSQKRLS